VQNFFTWTLGRAPNVTESTYWNDQLRVAYAQGQASVKLPAIELGKTLVKAHRRHVTLWPMSLKMRRIPLSIKIQTTSTPRQHNSIGLSVLCMLVDQWLASLKLEDYHEET
jgi:hypothetical protein